MVSSPQELLAEYAAEVAGLAESAASTEASYYPAIQRLLGSLLRVRDLPFDVRVNTSQRRSRGGTDLPDLALYDGTGDFVVVLGEVKLPTVEIAELANSTEQDDQIGRYLARTGVVLLSNVRSFGLLVIDPTFQGDGVVPPENRQLLEVVELWPSLTALTQRKAPITGSGLELADLLETAATEFSSIAEPESLARILARLARRAKADLPREFTGAVRPLLDDFSKALGLHFKDAEGEEFLRSSLIQTAFYGLFAGWTLWRHAGASKPFAWQDLGEYLKIPFLGALFHEFRHPLRLKEMGLAPHLDRATAALERVAVERFFSRFAMPEVVDEGGTDAASTSAILYFYEPFLEAFDPELRKQLGVWYTPQEIVRYQVRKVDRLLRDELDCPRGFADDRVVVLDPCCGTGAYLLEALRCVADQLAQEGLGAALANKLLDAFCRRIIGFEILTAPFVIAQLQLYLILTDLGVEPDEEHRPAIFLTNALTGWDGSDQLKLQFPELQQEHDAAQRVKREEKIIVILGNPPYNRFAGAPIDEEQDLVDHYKGIHRNEKGKQVGPTDLYRRFGIRKHLLDDLYIRFFRLAEVRIGEEAEYGVVSFISNSSYLSGRSHPLMREALLHSFDLIQIDNLNGDKYRTGKVIPNGLPGAGQADQSVFTTAHDPRGIQVGTAISTLLKRHQRSTHPVVAQVGYRDFWGMSMAKREALLASLEADTIAVHREKYESIPEGPRTYQSVEPTEQSRWKLVPVSAVGGYEDWPALDMLFPLSFMGVHTGKDKGVVGFDFTEMASRVKRYLDPGTSDDEISALVPELMTAANEFVDPAAFRKAMQADPAATEDRLKPYLYRPLDQRVIWYETDRRVFVTKDERWSGCLVQRYGEEFAKAIEFDNSFLCTVSQPRRVSESRPLISRVLVDLHYFDRGVSVIPAVLMPPPEERNLFHESDPNDRVPEANLAASSWSVISRAWGLKGDLADSSANDLVRQLFRLVLAIGHAPQFQLDHQDSLAQDWLRLPIPRDRELFLRCVAKGETVASLLDSTVDVSAALAELLGSDRRTLAVPSSSDGKPIRDHDLEITIPYFGAARGGWRERQPQDEEASDPAWGDGTGDLYLNQKVYLANVPRRIWNFELGGYPVIKKWLGYRDAKRRPGRSLSAGELDHLRAIVHRVAALLRLHRQLDICYELGIADAFTESELGL